MTDVIYCKSSVFQMDICFVIISPYIGVLKTALGTILITGEKSASS